jgi:starch phosphorylase
MLESESEPSATPTAWPAASRFPDIPERIAGLGNFAMNLSWSWSRDARALFRSIDGPLWHLTRHNPVRLLQRVERARLVKCSEDPRFLALYDRVAESFANDRSADQTWHAREFPDRRDRPIAYFCAEFGLHNSVPIYSGGLGVLAGDHCKAASDLGVPLVGVGLLYTRGYFDQTLRLDGWQEDADATFDLSGTPLEQLSGPDGESYLTWVYSSGRRVYVAAWRLHVGRVPVYLLDTDLDENDPLDRELSHKLYAGGVDLRLRQEGLLGIGGVRLLRALDIRPAVWHANEGHASFMLVERVRELTASGLAFEEAVHTVRQTSVFTTHTPVPAGHDLFTHEQIKDWMGPYWETIEPERELFLKLGYHPELDHGTFHMTAAALRLAGRPNGVSERHGRETRQIWAPLWGDRDAHEVPIRHVTNGAHLATWTNHGILDLLDEHFGPGWEARVDDPAFWEGVLELDDRSLWETHRRLKSSLIDFIREEARRRWRDKWTRAAHVVGAGTLLTPWAFTIGFARRFAAYKRADLLFRDPDRLLDLLTNPWRPVQVIFAGKAHPKDEDGKRLLQSVYEHTRDQRFEGRIGFLEEYDMHLAHRLVQGVDLWLNVPKPPLEASGTSGMKAALNAVPQLGTLDGWWAEGYTGHNGWALPPAKGDEPDDLDSEHLYTALEQQIVPLFYDRDEQDVPRDWVERMKHALMTAGQRFTCRRMVQEYVRDYYVPASRDPEPDDPPTF